MQKANERVEYTVEEIIYRNEETGFSVLYGTTSEKVAVTAIGELMLVDEGEKLFLTGEYVDHSTYGRQFKVSSFERQFPSSEAAIRKFLSSARLKGIGPIIANRIVDCFGTETLKIIETDPMQLVKVKGISSQLSLKIASEVEKLFAMKRLMMFLENFEVSPIIGVKALKKWGIFALEILKSNPYRLCEEGIELSFSFADKIAKELNFETSDYNRISCGIEYILKHNAKENGHTCAPKKSIVSVAEKFLEVSELKISEILDEMCNRHALFSCRFGKVFLFLPIYYLAEKYIAKRVAALALVNRSLQNETFNELIKIEEEHMQIKLVEKQKKAIKKAITSGIFILSGGPGTGKTTILNVVISILEQKGLKIAICAPTGRAAKRICDLTKKEATTIHRLLGVQSNKDGFNREFIHNEKNLLKEDVVIVDEMSMVDCLLFSNLMKALKSSCSVILTGDNRQLPSVMAGNVFKNLLSVNSLQNVELDEIFRQSAKSLIVSNAHAIVNNCSPVLDRVDGDFFFIEKHSAEIVVKTVVELYCKRLPKYYNYDPIKDIQVICFSKKGLVGTVNLNKELQSQINPKSKKRPEFSFGYYIFREGDKVMQIKNNYDICWTMGSSKGESIFNGDIGYIEKIDVSKKIFSVNFDGKIVIYSIDMAKELELAYAITVHKAQGNEFKSAIIPVLGKNTEFYSRNLLYTAITRAKENLVLVGDRAKLQNMCCQLKVNYRYSCLCEFLKEELENEVSYV